MAISFNHRGNFKNTERFFKWVTKGEVWRSLDAEAQKGLAALSSATPIDTGYTKDSWDYQIKNDGGDWSIVWSNYHVNKGVNIAVILHFGHGTGTGGYVQGRQYITPAIAPVFLEISDRVWKAVTKA